MTETQLHKLAKDLMNLHGINLPVIFTNSRTTLGAIVFSRMSGAPLHMKLSRRILGNYDIDTITDTILHEIAHVLAGHAAGHGPKWKQTALALGVQPSRLHKLSHDVEKKVSKYEVTCASCGDKVYYNRKKKYPLSRYIHKKCGGTLA